MARVVPSQVVGFTKQVFPFTEHQVDAPAAMVALGAGHAVPLAALLELVEQIPGELITVQLIGVKSSFDTG